MADIPKAKPHPFEAEMDLARELAAEITQRYRPRDPALLRPGLARGIDCYKPEALVVVLANTLATYRRLANRLPDILRPRLYSEKLNALKFLAHLRVPESGNKLLTGRFITPEVSALLRVPEVVWHSAEPVLPPNSMVPQGDYYLKTNHGSGRCRRIRYPLSADARVALEAMAARWMSRGHGMLAGEWWYNVFARRLMLERTVTRRNPSAVILFYVFKGKVGLIALEEKYLDGTGRNRVCLFDRSFRPLQRQKPGVEAINDFTIPDALIGRAVEVAEAIGRPFDAVRVDILPGDEGALYLNEITFTSNSGRPPSTPGLDEELGELWGGCSFII